MGILFSAQPARLQAWIHAQPYSWGAGILVQATIKRGCLLIQPNKSKFYLHPQLCPYKSVCFNCKHCLQPHFLLGEMVHSSMCLAFQACCLLCSAGCPLTCSIWQMWFCDYCCIKTSLLFRSPNSIRQGKFHIFYLKSQYLSLENVWFVFISNDDFTFSPSQYQAYVKPRV